MFFEISTMPNSTAPTFGLRYRISSPSYTTDWFIDTDGASYSNESLDPAAKSKGKHYDWEAALIQASHVKTWLREAGYPNNEVQICQRPSWRVAKKIK